MNSFLLSVGVAIVLALFAALVGPYFVDWNGYRGMFEARLTEIAGRPVSIGHVDEFRILPMPVFKASEVSIGSSLGLRTGEQVHAQPFFSAPRVTARMALTPLLSGEFQIEEVRLEEPVLSVTVDAEGRAVLPPRPAGDIVDPERVSLDLFDVRNGTVILTDSRSDTVWTMSEINLAGQATSLAGPIRAEGGFVAGGTLYNLRLGTGRVAGGALRTKLALNPAGARFSLAFDGQLSGAGNKPHFTGGMRLDHSPPPAEAVGDSSLRSEIAFPWRVSATIDADPDMVRLDKLVLGIGAEARAVQLNGAAAMPVEPGGRLAVELGTRQIDLDRALGAQPGATVTVANAVAGLPGFLDGARALSVPVDLRLRADAILLNGALTESVGLDAALDGDTLNVAEFDALLPGHGRATWSGRIDLSGAVTGAHGDLSLHVRQAGRLAQWLGQDGRVFGPLRLRADDAALALDAAVDISGEEVGVTGLEARLDDALVTGDIVYRRGADRALRLALEADTLDLDRYFEVASQPPDDSGKEDQQVGAPPDLAVNIKASNVRVGGIEARGLDGDFTYEDGNLAIRRLKIGDAGGAALDASGRIEDLLGQADGEIEARLSADKLDGVLGLAGDLGVLGGADALIASRAAALSPARAGLTLKAVRTGTGSDISGRLNGTFGGTDLDIMAKFAGTLAAWRDGDLSLSVDGKNPDSRDLVAQLAGRDIALRDGGAASFTARVEGVPGTGAELALDAALFDARASAQGTLTLAEASRFDGKASLDADTARVLAALLDLPAGGEALAQPVRAAADISGGGGSWTATGITGAAGGGGFDGDLEVTLPETGPAKAAAHIGVDQADLAWLMALLLGEDSRLDTADQWPRGPFALRAPFGAEAAVTLDVKRLDLPGGEAASDARLPITIAPDRVAITQATGKLFGGAIKLDARFTGGDSGIGAAASMALSDAALERMAWALDGGQTAATGRFDLSAQVSGSGRSWLGLISSLDGDGSFAARGGVMRGLSTDAFAKTLKAASSGLEIAEPAVSETFGAYLAAAPLAYENFEGEFTIEDGIVSARNIALDAPGANAKVSAFIDLPGRKIDSEWQISPDAPDQAAVPPVALVFAGPLGAPERSLDVHALTGFLTVRRLEADLERLEDAQADAREREFFDRKLDNLRRAHMERVREQREKARAEAEAREQERKRQEAEAEERARQEHEAEIRKQEQVDEQGRPTASDGAERQPGPGASLERPDEEKSAAGAADEPASVETPQQADQRRRDALERLVEEALRDSAPPDATFSTPPATTNATREGEIIREALPPPRPPAAIPNGSRGDAPAAQAAPEKPPTRREAAAGSEKDAPEDDAPPQTVPPAAQPAPPSQKSIRLEFDPLESGR